MYRIVDLTLELYNGAPVWEGDPLTVIKPYETVGDSVYTVSQLCISSHAGTHIDAPFHFFKNGAPVDRIPLSKFAGPAQVLDFTGKGPRDIITVQDLCRYDAQIGEGKRIILHTGWYKHFPDTLYFKEMPELTVEACRFLADKKIACIALDVPSVNTTQYREAHMMLLEKDILIVESLANLCDLREKEVFFLALPLRIKGCDGSPCRAVAIEGYPWIP